MKPFDELESKRVFDFFYEISQIPRESKHEKRISDYLVKFAQDRNLWVKQDEIYNVIIKKDGVGSLKDAQPVILQGHMDMVAERGEGSTHNFDTDPIEWVVKGDYLYANNTTLGGDDGIGVALALALLDDTTMNLPPLEVVITVDEETGMTGVNGIDVSDLTGKIFINIDSEEEGLFYLSCAGGNRTRIEIPVSYKEVEGTLVEVDVTGLIGGHSGSEIHQERASSPKLLGRYLNMLLEKEIKFNLIEVTGGSKDNVISREANAKLVINDVDYETLEQELETLNKALKIEYTPQDPDAKLVLNKKDSGKYQAMKFSDTTRIVYALVLVPYGPTHYSRYIKDLVQTSSNPGVLKTDENLVTIGAAIRSSVDSQKQELVEFHRVIGKTLGANVITDSSYPAWPYDDNSKIKDLFLKKYKELFNKDAKVVAIHAGLECGLFKEKMGDGVDFISFGPNLFGAHTAEEHMSISSADRSWKFIKAILQSIKEY